MKQMIRVISNILFVVLAVSLIFAIFVFLIPRFTPIQYRAVRTGSMEPDIPVGSMVVVVPTSADNIKVGDDVTYVSQSNQVVTHRVLNIDLESGVFTTYGIANGVDNADPPVAYENIIGVAKFHIPWIGPAILYLDTLSGKIAAITVILVIALLGALLSVIAKGRQSGKQSAEPPNEAETSGITRIPFQKGERTSSPAIKSPRLQGTRLQKKVRPEETDAFWIGDDEM